MRAATQGSPSGQAGGRRAYPAGSEHVAYTGARFREEAVDPSRCRLKRRGLWQRSAADVSSLVRRQVLPNPSTAAMWPSSKPRLTDETPRFQRVPEEPSAGLEPATPSLPWRFQLVENGAFPGISFNPPLPRVVRILRRFSRPMFP